MISRWVGETEKHLDRVFALARNGNAILFFDEADALFGKRSEVKDAHDRCANREVAFLLQRLEVFEGVVILASNLARNLDQAFSRRLHFTISMQPGQRYLWVVDEDGAFVMAQESQPANLYPERSPPGQIKHGDLVPGAGGQVRGQARAGGEMWVEVDPASGQRRIVINNVPVYLIIRMLGLLDSLTALVLLFIGFQIPLVMWIHCCPVR